jgi:ABC-type Mn2+/Zn2+ transport system ATPase subunit
VDYGVPWRPTMIAFMSHSKVHLKAVRIEGFRSCERTSIEFNNSLSVLIGPNGAGKTNILQALTLLRPPTERFHRQRATDAAVSRSRIFAEFQAGTKQLALRSTLSYTLDEENREAVVAASDDWRIGRIDNRRKGSGGEWISVAPEYATARHLAMVRGQMQLWNVRPLPKDQKKWQPMQKAVTLTDQFRSRISYYSAAQFTNPVRCPSSIEIDEDRDLIRSPLSRREHQKFLVDLYRLRETSPTKYASYMSLVGKQGLGLISNLFWKQVKVASSQIEVRTGGKVVKRNRQRLLIVPSVQNGRDRLSFSQLSEGTFKTLALVFYLITDDSDLLLIEEPEVCVHHGLLSSIVELIKNQSAEKQIVFSTHSDFVLDQVESDQVFSVIRREDKGTVVRSLSAGYSRQSVEALREFLQTSGNLGEYWRQGGFDR